MLGKIFDTLQEKDIDVYFIGQHQGDCISPYVVIKDFGDNEISGISLDQNIIDFIIFCPIGRFEKVEEYVEEVKETLRSIEFLQDARYRSPILLDQDKKAYTTSMRYKRYKAFIR